MKEGGGRRMSRSVLQQIWRQMIWQTNKQTNKPRTNAVGNLDTGHDRHKVVSEYAFEKKGNLYETEVEMRKFGILDRHAIYHKIFSHNAQCHAR